MNEEKTDSSEETSEEATTDSSEETPEEAPEETSEETAEASVGTTEEAPEETAEASAGDEGTGDEGTGDEGTGDEGTGDEGTGETPEPDASNEASAKPLPEHSYEELHGMTVAQLREVAEGIEADALHGYTTMHKEHLLPALCGVLGIEAHEHHEVVGIDKGGVKEKIRALKKERDAAESAADSAKLKRVRRKIRSLKRKLRKSIV